MSVRLGHISATTCFSRHPEAVLNQLLHLGKVRWLTRLRGLTLLSEPEFGPFRPRQSSSNQNWLSDPVTGLKIRPSAIRQIRLFGKPEAGELEFLIELGDQTEILITKTYLQKEPNDVLRRIKKYFGFDGSIIPVPWMDEWTDCANPCSECPHSCYSTATRISNWKELSLTIETRALRITSQIRPTWTDRDQSILRIFDSKQQKSIYIDLTSPLLRVTQNDEGSGELHFTSL